MATDSGEEVEFLRFELPSEPVEAKDLAREREQLNAYLDAAEADEAEALRTLPVTPWVAWQVGILAEQFISQGDPETALLYALAAFIAADRSGDPARVYANHLTLANAYLRAGGTARAIDMYSAILRLPLPGGRYERASAQMSLGTTHINAGRTREGLHHIERAYHYLSKHLEGKTRESLHGYLARKYGEVVDLAGMWHCAQRAGLPSPPPKDLLWPVIDDHFNNVLRVYARLRFFGDDDVADELIDRWKRSREEKQHEQ